MSAYRRTFVTVAALALLAGCGETGGAGSPAGPDNRLADLQGRTFESVSLVDGADKPLQPGTRVSLSFAADSVSGSAGCNSVGSTARVADGELVVEGPVGGTEMGCGDRQYHDQWISDLLTSRPQLALVGDRLTLTSDGTVVRLQDRASAEPDQPLAGTLWTLESMQTGPGPGGSVSSVPTRVTSTLQFGGDGDLHARPGCNTGSAGYDVDPVRLTLEPMEITLLGCGGARTDVESAVLTVLRGGVAWSVDGSQLRLTKGERTLVYRAT